MHIHTLRIRNFRRLRDVLIDLAPDISIFVGANNSGKTSTAQALHLFTGASRERFSLHDFSAACWAEIDAFGENAENTKLPAISIDIWLHVEAVDLHRVVDLLPSLNWEGSLVGIRIEFAASDEAKLLTRFHEARTKAQANAQRSPKGTDYQPSPRTLCEYLSDNLRREFELRYYVLDRARFDESFVETADYTPLQMTPDKGRGGKDVLNSLLRVDFLNAQRHLTDSAGESRAEDLSRHLSRFYKRNLEKREDDTDTIHALAQSKTMLNEHLARVFEPTLRRLGDLSYPGITNPRPVIKSALNPATVMSSNDGARIHYALGDAQGDGEESTLPDHYNGLGFKNLIYMVVELLDFHAQWMDIEENRPPLHLIFIEEPEAHLHTQLQQVFVRKVLNILSIEGDDQTYYSSQIVITTHSPHILYERGFRPIRYFRRSEEVGVAQSSEVLNLSAFYARTEPSTRDFLERYLKLTHCDLFFADAAVLVEGNVERLLLPQMIETAAKRLLSACLSILEIGGAFGHRFRSLIEFLGLTTLIITDIDSVTGKPVVADEETGQEPAKKMTGDESGTRTACMVHHPGAETSNQTLIQWLPRRTKIEDLLEATEEERTQRRTANARALIRVVYQTKVNVTWRGETEAFTGRTLEEAFAFANLEWCQNMGADLKLSIRNHAALPLRELVEKTHHRIKGSTFKKTDFALALLSHDPNTWVVPGYILDGLLWLQDEVTPHPQPSPTPAIIAAEAAPLVADGDTVATAAEAI